MGQKFAAYNTAGLVNAFYDSIDSPVPDGAIAIEITDAQWRTCIATQGYTVIDGALIAPPPPTEEQMAAQAAASAVQDAFVAGLAMTSASSPAINGTYAVDPGAQARITAVEAFIERNSAFPGSAGTSLAWPDLSGVAHIFTSTALFSEFATAVANYVADLDLYAAGAPGAVLPAASVTIA